VTWPDDLEEEIERIVRENYGDLERHLLYGPLGLPSHLAGEVINDAFLVVAMKRRRGDAIANTRAYLFRVARNAAIDRLRGLYAIEAPDSPALEAVQEPCDYLENMVISEDLRKAVKQLPMRQRQVVVLRYLSDFTVEETATILGIARGTVGPTASRALLQLNKMLSGQAEGLWAGGAA
jgi:RNA polymerase sigma factor (sigma-70 family)